MPLKVTLKAHEKIIIDGAVVTNGAGKTELVIENNVPVLRQKDVLTPADATSPCRRIYLAIQLMYVDGENLSRHNRVYWKLVRDVLDAAPSTAPLIHQINEKISAGNYFAALKMTKKLIAYEQEAMDHVRRNSGSL
jgi:flagellar biosynthesis repressor protein FlbT